MGAWFRIRSSLLAVRMLTRRLGAARCGRVLWRLGRRSNRGEPWTELGPPADADEQECRQQCGDVVLLYDLLSEEIGRDDARALLSGIVRESAILHLKGLVPRIERRAFEAMAPADRESFLGRIVRRFPNATISDLRVTDDGFSYDISGCLFVDLTTKVGVPELAPLFCSGDGLYFDRHLPEVVLDRPETLAEGGRVCAFRFRWR